MENCVFFISTKNSFFEDMKRQNQLFNSKVKIFILKHKRKKCIFLVLPKTVSSKTRKDKFYYLIKKKYC